MSSRNSVLFSFTLPLVALCLSFLLTQSNEVPNEGEEGYYIIEGYLSSNENWAHGMVDYNASHPVETAEALENGTIVKLAKNTPIRVIKNMKDVSLVSVPNIKTDGWVETKFLRKIKLP